MARIQDRVFQVAPELLGYRRLANAVLMLALKDWAGIGPPDGGSEVSLAMRRIAYRRSGRHFWQTDWARALCDYVGLNYRLIVESMRAAEREPERMMAIAKRLRRMPLAGG